MGLVEEEEEEGDGLGREREGGFVVGRWPWPLSIYVCVSVYD